MSILLNLLGALAGVLIGHAIIAFAPDWQLFWFERLRLRRLGKRYGLPVRMFEDAIAYEQRLEVEFKRRTAILVTRGESEYMARQRVHGGEILE